MLGDGCLYLDKYNKYQTTISLHYNELQYLFYCKDLFENIFKYKFCITKVKGQFLLRNISVFVGKKLIEYGLINGNKVHNNVKIPKWVFTRKKFLISTLRGIFDTDGSVYRKYNYYAQIQFKFGCLSLLKSVREISLILNYYPTKIQKEIKPNGHICWKFYLSRQKEIERFFNEIKPANQKHILRYNFIKNGDIGI